MNQPKAKVAELLETLSTKNDCIWPKEKWPTMRFKTGTQVGVKGGHGPIKYTVEIYKPSEAIQFKFSNPKGFNGIHKFELTEIANAKTEIKHTIDMQTGGTGTFLWIFAIHSLHNALIEDGFDTLENNFSEIHKSTKWNLRVRFLRKQIAK